MPAPTLHEPFLQESLDAAQRAQADAGDSVAAAGHTTTGQTLRQQTDAAIANANPEVRKASAFYSFIFFGLNL